MTPDLESNLIPEDVKRLLDEGQWQEAVGALNRALEANPREMTLWRAKANTLLAMNQSEAALACYDRMLEIDPRNPLIYSEKAAVLETVDRDDEALVCYDHALAINGSDVTALAGKAQLLVRLGKIPEAISVYDKLLQLKPQDPEILIAKGDALIAAGQIDQAASYFEQAAAARPSSFGAAEWTTRGDALSTNNQAENALKCYDRAIAADPRYVWAYQGKASVLQDMPERSDEALRFLRTAIDLDERNASLWVYKGNIHFDRKEYQDAASCYAKATELDPNLSAAWGNLGLAQEALKDYAAAVESAEKRLTLDPTSAVGWVNKGSCLDQLSRLEEAAASYLKALELDPNNFWANNNLGWNLTHRRKYKEAMPFYDKAIQVNLQEDLPWLNKALNMLDQGLYAGRVLDTLNRALEVVRDKREVLRFIAWIYTEHLFQHDKALACYEQVLRLDPTDIGRHADIADCLIRMGRYAEGRAEAEKVVGRLEGPEAECSVSLMILASYALEGDARGRAKQFEVVLEQLNKCCQDGKPREPSTSDSEFRGLLNTIHASNITSEAKFLVSTAIDLKQGSVSRSALSFFNAAKLQTAPASVDTSMTSEAGTPPHLRA